MSQKIARCLDLTCSRKYNETMTSTRTISNPVDLERRSIRNIVGGDMFQRANISHFIMKREQPETGHFFWINSKSMQKLDIKRVSIIRKITKLTF